MKVRTLFATVCFLLMLVQIGSASDTKLLRFPTVSETHIAFVYAGDIWLVERAGGTARQLTTAEGLEVLPRFSPDGSQIAFTGEYDGNTDVFVMPAQGGEPKRLTYHPGADNVRGWTNDGRNILFASGRDSAPVPYGRLWQVSVDGGYPESLPLPMAHRGVYSPDGTRMAYVPFGERNLVWRHYRGGTTTPVWIVDMETLDIEMIPRDNSNDTHPMWIGNTVFFTSDRNGTINLFSYDVNSKEVRQVTFHEDFDIRYASEGADVIVYEQGGYIHLYDPARDHSQRISIRVTSDRSLTRPRFVNAGEMIRDAEISPNGVRALFEARGDIFTVPAEKGDIRNITNESGVHNRYPAWSPDGKSIAWFSDKSGEYQLMIGEQSGLDEPKVISFEDPNFYYSPVWSPDSKMIAFTDKHLNLWYLNVDDGKPVKVDTDTYEHPQRSMHPVWSPDSKWLSYAKRLRNHLRAIHIYSIDEGRTYQITDGLSDAVSPAFDKNGKYLYFLASTNVALNTGWLDMTSYERPVVRDAYLVVLSKDESSPFARESDEEKVEEEKDEEKNDNEEVQVRIDFENIDQRIVSVENMPGRDYRSLRTAGEGRFFYLESVPNQQGFTLHTYDLDKRETSQFISGIYGYTVSANGKKLLYGAPGNIWGIVDASGTANVGDGKLNTGTMQVQIDPRAEWEQIYRESWRINRDFLYAPNMHGADWDAMKEKYRDWVDHVGHRTDLTYVLQHILSELVIGHSYVGGGDSPSPKSVEVGLLGADYVIENGFYRISKIYTGENWNPDLRAPLTEPGSNVREGEYILAVNGRELRAPTNIYSLFQGTANRQTVLQVNTRPSLQGARTVTVVPVASEWGLRQRAWVEDNRRKVEEQSDGKLAYVYLPNTAGAGYSYFNRYFFAQMDKQGAVIDERFNGGGSAADYIVDLLDRPVLNYWHTRDGEDFKTPLAAMDGPKVMIINEHAGSGGDALPYYFRKRGIGPLIGTTTWGGLVGIYDYPALIDGGFVTAPRVAFYNVDGEWEVENEGVDPDIEVVQLPGRMRDGGDPQLERAIHEALRMLEENPPARVDTPEYPVRVK
jgi:tricorn protease